MLNNLLSKTSSAFKGSLKARTIQKVGLRMFNEKINKTRKNYYEILGIAKTATEEEIKIAYRTLAKKYHPDVNITASTTHEPNVDKFRDIADAYAVLSNKTMRLDYDMRIRKFPDADYSPQK